MIDACFVVTVRHFKKSSAEISFLKVPSLNYLDSLIVLGQQTEDAPPSPINCAGEDGLILKIKEVGEGRIKDHFVGYRARWFFGIGTPPRGGPYCPSLPWASPGRTGTCRIRLCTSPSGSKWPCPEKVDDFFCWETMVHAGNAGEKSDDIFLRFDCGCGSTKKGWTCR